MANVIIPNNGTLSKKGINPGAYSGELICPCCESTANRFIEAVTPTRLRYRCRKCGITFQYDISNRLDQHPYAPLARAGRYSGPIRQLLDRIDHGRHTKGGSK